MKKILIFLLVSFVASSCCGNPKRLDKAHLDELTMDMAQFNKRLRGRLYAFDLKQDISQLNSSLYENYTIKYAKESDGEYVKFLMAYKPEISLVANKKDFVVCLNAKEIELILCDKATTAVTDIVRSNQAFDIPNYLSHALR